MAGSDVVQAMRLALKPFNIQHLADDWAAQAAEKMLITNMSTLQFVTDTESEAWANLFALLPDPPVPVAARAVIGASLKQVLSGDGDGHAGGGDGNQGRGGKKRKADEVETPKPPLKLRTGEALTGFMQIFPSAELSNDASGWKRFSNAEHINLYRFKSSGDKATRSKEVGRRWKVKNGPTKATHALNKRGGLAGKVKHFLDGPQKRKGDFKAPRVSKSEDREAAEGLQSQLQALRNEAEDAMPAIDSELAGTDAPAKVRIFTLVRKHSAVGAQRCISRSRAP